MNTKETFRCWAEIDQEALRHNAGVVRDRVGPKVSVIAVVKANAYGHGMIGVATALVNDAQFFGVANLEEARALRKEIWHPIIILGPALPEERAAIVGDGFIPSVSTLEEARDFDRAATGGSVSINLDIDTGMGRMGVLQEQARELFFQIMDLPNLRIQSVSTHLPVSDEDEAFTRTQLAEFSALVEELRVECPIKFQVHALPSAGVLGYGDAPFDLVRTGLMLYGISPLAEYQKLLRPVMTWKTRIVVVRDLPAGHGISYGRTFITPREMRVATLAAGYADGYPRHLSNHDAVVLVRGKRCPLLGRVTMDLTMIDVSHLRDASVGDEVVLMGRQGDEEISATELAERAATITWEITTRVGARVRRVFV